MTNEEIMKLAHAAGWEQGSQFDDCGDCSGFDVVKFARMVAEVWCKRVDAEQQDSSDMADAYAGAREDIETWKKRAMEAEELNRKFIAGINGQTYMGEPAASPTAGMTLGERIMHVGGRENANGYIEFGSVMAVGALIKQMLRDTRPQPAQHPQVPLVDQVIKALADYCNAGEIDCADDLLASVMYAADPEQQPAQRYA